MFSGLNNLLRKVLPKRLFYRALLIVAVPVIVLQLIITTCLSFFSTTFNKKNSQSRQDGIEWESGNPNDLRFKTGLWFL